MDGTVNKMDETTAIVKCTVCGTEVIPKRKGTCSTTQIIVGTVYWDYMDCPSCGCQILLNKRLMDDVDLSLVTDNSEPHVDLEPITGERKVYHGELDVRNGTLTIYGSDRCVCCGEPVPEGRMVCPSCERRAEK